jgi:hypothetical protein
MNTQSLVREELDRPQTRTAFETAFHSVRLLIGGYVAISAATLVAIVLMRNHPAEVTSAVWIRGTIVVASALLMTLFAKRAARGASRMYLRLRLVSAIMVVAIVAIIAVPRRLPGVDEDRAGRLRDPADRRRRHRQQQARSVAVRRPVTRPAGAYP